MITIRLHLGHTLMWCRIMENGSEIRDWESDDILQQIYYWIRELKTVLRIIQSVIGHVNEEHMDLLRQRRRKCKREVATWCSIWIAHDWYWEPALFSTNE